VSEVWLEIGFGGAEHLIWQAQRHPEVGFIGAEPFVNGVAKLLDAVEAKGLGNVRVWDDDARALLAWLPDASVSRVFVLFPDPWPKLRHRKRRIVSSAFGREIARILRPAGELRLATDIGDYAAQMLIEIGSVDGLTWTAERAADWRLRPSDWPQTRYEAKAGREGRRSAYLRFRRSS
jgi:tRNA (guanine-N7-)-methyltransferase